jgi:hypothetical protein
MGHEPQCIHGIWSQGRTIAGSIPQRSEVFLCMPAWLLQIKSSAFTVTDGRKESNTTTTQGKSVRTRIYFVVDLC